MLRRFPRQGPCVAFIRRSPERRRPGDEKREQGNARGGAGETRKGGLGVERPFASGEAARELDGGRAGAAAGGRHAGQGHVLICVCRDCRVGRGGEKGSDMIL